MEDRTVVTSDDHQLGTVVAERDDCVVIETGHIFKSKHAIPRTFLHEVDGVLRATVTKDVIDDSPKVDLDNWDCAAVREHFGLDAPFEVDPDPDAPGPEADAARAGLKTAPQERLDVLEGNDAAGEMPVIRDRMANAADPSGSTANLSNENRTGGEKA